MVDADAANPRWRRVGRPRRPGGPPRTGWRGTGRDGRRPARTERRCGRP